MDPILKPGFSFVDEALVKGFTSNKKLSILLSKDGLSYAVAKSSSDEILAIEVFSFQNPPADLPSGRDFCDGFWKILKDREWLNKKYASNNIVFRGQESTLMPSSLFVADAAADYLKFNHPVSADDIINHAEIKPLQLIYSIPGCILKTLESHFGTYTLAPYLQHLLKLAFLEARPFRKEDFIMIDVHPTMFYLIVIRDNNLIFSNSFQYHTHEDLIYYMMFTLKQLGIKPAGCKLNILGRVRKESVLTDSMERYFSSSGIIRTTANKVLLDSIEHETGFIPQILLF